MQQEQPHKSTHQKARHLRLEDEAIKREGITRRKSDPRITFARNTSLLSYRSGGGRASRREAGSWPVPARGGRPRQRQGGAQASPES